MAIQAFMLDSAFVRSVPLFAEPTRRSPAPSASDHDSHRPSSWSCGVVTPVSNTLRTTGGAAVVGATGRAAVAVAAGDAGAGPGSRSRPALPDPAATATIPMRTAPATSVDLRNDTSGRYPAPPEPVPSPGRADATCSPGTARRRSGCQ